MNQAMALWGTVIRKLWNWECAFRDETCDGPLEAHHMISRSVRYYSLDPRCGILVCRTHHSIGSKTFFGLLRKKYRNVAQWLSKHRWSIHFETVDPKKRIAQLSEIEKLIDQYGYKQIRKNLWS